MLRKALLLGLFAVVCCQYRPAPEDYEDDYAPPPPRRAPPPPPPVASRPGVVHKPADVHYVNIGLELAGDYKFGYDTGRGNDGQSFREETRLPDGTVQGAYGYVDETGKQRIVKYTAGKDGFKAEGDVGPERAAPRSAPRAAPAPQQAYRAPPAPQPQAAPRPAPQPQPAYRAPPQAQPAYRAPQPAPQPQPAYRAPPPQPQPAYRPPPPQPQPAYAPEPQYAPRPRSQPRPAPRARPAPRPVERYDEEPDYDYPTNEIRERRLVPVDTSLFNYNIGTSQGNKN